MSAVQETRKTVAAKATKRAAQAETGTGLLARIVDGLSSVKFGVALLVVLAALSMIGMLIMQQNVEGFDKYYVELQPSQKLLYGTLKFFDIYHAWYFNLIILVLSLNIVLSSIDHFPKTWRVIRRRKLQAGRAWLLSQQQHAELTVESESSESAVEKIKGAFKSAGLRTTLTEKQGRTFIFGERGAWNRLGAYAVHVALLLILAGGFMTAQLGREGQMPLGPGESSSEISSVSFNLDQISNVNTDLPFTVTCTDIEQKLINKEGSIMANNTIDWLTRIRITDETGIREGVVHLNEPLDYRGYRFFQSSFVSFGQARNVTLRLTPEAGGEPQVLTIRRDGTASLADGTKIEFDNFQPDFIIGQTGRPDSASGEYNNPVAVLNVTTPQGQQKAVYAFSKELPAGAPVTAPFGGYQYRMTDFEKVPLQHVLAVQKDPGRTPFYLGSALLVLTLCGVFFFSHQRVWALVEARAEGIGFDVTIGGNTNRNKLGFEDRFRKLASAIGADQTGGKE